MLVHLRPGNDFDLAALGAYLPGVVPAAPKGRPKARFSLVGVQLNLSVAKNPA